MNKETWQDRLLCELFDVEERLAKLEAFLRDGGAEAAGVTGAARDLLVEQRVVMRAYLDVLNRRVAAAGLDSRRYCG